MALRVLTYAGLLWQKLVTERRLTDGKLPPVLPVVLYSGEPRWRAPVACATSLACRTARRCGAGSRTCATISLTRAGTARRT
jgi:hypothetical protein